MIGRSRGLWGMYAALTALCVAPLAGAAQTGVLTGTVVRAESEKGIEGASVRIEGSDLGAFTDVDGRFRITGLPAGTHHVDVTVLGFAGASRMVEVLPGGTATLRLELAPRPIELGGIEVAVLRPSLDRQGELTQAQVRAANPRDMGEVLRALEGVDAVRRGPLGLDPVVRGLRETEVGTYLDGVRMFPAGPARMDSPLTHLDPGAITRVEVVKGPYALTWGAGNLAAIRVETADLPEAGKNLVTGNVFAGFDSNHEAAETFGSVRGRQGVLSYWASGAYREGSDYEDGDGNLVPGDFESWEGRGKLGVDVSDATRFVFGGGYQEQGPIDYPGRLLDAEFFETLNASFAIEHRPPDSPIGALDLLVYYNRVEHGMNNDEKPTARRDPNRTPSFPLEVDVNTRIDVLGGRLAMTMDLGPAEIEIGGDTYFTDRSAFRTISSAEADGPPLFEDFMWPDAEHSLGGPFLRTSGTAGIVDWSATVRGDFLKANADSLSIFFVENVSGTEEIAQQMVSAAVTLGFRVDPHWNVSVGVGSAARPADVNEFYSDRIPATKAQISAEFVGNPALEPERSNQADLWIEAHYPRVHGHVNAFVRRIDDFITLEATDPALPRRLPLSPETVFQYVNGEAEFWGVEAGFGYAATRDVTVRADASWLRGDDTFLDEPALGVAPLNGAATVRYDERFGRFFVEGMVRVFAEQDRVATTRGETPTESYWVGDLRAGYNLLPGLNLRGGVLNVADRFYVNHLNAKNPFTGSRIAEAGRVFYLDLGYSF